MKRLIFALLVLTCSATQLRAAGLKLSMHDGLVSIDAQDVTVRQILTEWARVGNTRIINAERIAGGPITIKIDEVPEKQALDIILRSIPGYMAVPRVTRVANASQYDRILIMATTTVVASAARPAQQPAPGPGFPDMQQGLPGGPNSNLTQLRPGGVPPPLWPGALPDPNAADQMDDPAIAAAAAAGLVPVPAFNQGPAPITGPLMPPGSAAQQPATPATGAGAPTNPWNAPVGTAQPSLAPPPPPTQPPPASRVRPPQADR